MCAIRKEVCGNIEPKGFYDYSRNFVSKQILQYFMIVVFNIIIKVKLLFGPFIWFWTEPWNK